MARVGFTPVDSLSRLQEELDRFFGRPLFDFGLSGPNVFPLINVFTDQDGWVVRAEVPGVQPDQVEIEIEPRALKISGERKSPTEDMPGGLHRRERRFGKFSRTVQLPRDLDVQQATAEIKHGVLTIRIPKAAAAKPRLVEIKAA
ncbi:MAG TPA: Hsp20/alpha crystallin family protein [Terriglobales bacterium]|nr:Hsp20/alpha crystallin family protein [Terriglobales bacterium]